MKTLLLRLETGTAWRRLLDAAPRPDPYMKRGYGYLPGEPCLMLDDSDVPDYWPTWDMRWDAMLDTMPLLEVDDA